MYIQEAVKKALEERSFITRESIDNAISYRATKIKPTNSYANCIIHVCDPNGKEIGRCKNWNPSAEDLMADDWILAD